MPFSEKNNVNPCTVCKSDSNFRNMSFNVGEVVDCERCGDFHISHVTADNLGLPFEEPKEQALASHIIRKMYASTGRRVELTKDFFDALKKRALPTPAEAADNLILWMANQADGRPGRVIKLVYANRALLATLGVIEEGDVRWLVQSLQAQNLLSGTTQVGTVYTGRLASLGWQRFEELKRAHVSSSFAFFARKFDNPDLDQIYNTCLWQAVKDTGYELRTVTQRAGLIDAIIEDEIRRCRFLIADLSDSNAGAYWEAGFAEGLGKPVIYICKTDSTVHFDADHRHTVPWDLSDLALTATKIKAVIRNTLLGDAKQTD